MKTAFVLTILVVVTFGYRHDPGRGWGVVSKRDADGDARSANVQQLISDLLSRARDGITAADLGDAAQELQEAVDEIIDGDGGEVPQPEVHALIQELAASFNGDVAVSALFDDPLTYEGSVLDAGLTLLNALSERAQESGEEGRDSVLAAISLTARAIQGIVVDTVEIVRYQGDSQEDDGRAKRWSFIPGDDNGSGNPFDDIYRPRPSWKRAAKRALKRSVQKRQWSASVNGQYHGQGNYQVGGSISYSWKR